MADSGELFSKFERVIDHVVEYSTIYTAISVMATVLGIETFTNYDTEQIRTASLLLAGTFVAMRLFKEYNKPNSR